MRSRSLVIRPAWRSTMVCSLAEPPEIPARRARSVVVLGQSRQLMSMEGFHPTVAGFEAYARVVGVDLTEVRARVATG